MGSPNFNHGRPAGAPIALFIHTMGGSLAGCDAWFSQSRSQVSAHYGAGLEGELHQYVRLEDVAWANGVLEVGNTWPGPAGVNPNALSVSIETEDRGLGHMPVTQGQYLATLQAGELALTRYPSIEYLMPHTVVSPRSRPSCCGDRWIESGRLAQLATELGLELYLA